MAILSKIRQLPIILLILVIGLPLLTFVMDPSALTDFFNANKVNAVGQVGDQSITRKEFAEALDTYRANAGGRVSEMQAAKSVWNNLVREKVYKEQLSQSGITIGEVDIMQSLYEAPFIQNDERYQTTGVFDKNKFKSYLATVKNTNPRVWNDWQDYMSSVKTNLETSTYNNLVAAGLGASLKEGEYSYKSENTKVSGEFVYVPFTTISDSLITVKKSEIQSYIDAHKDDFQVEASRDIDFVKFDVKASAQDQTNIKNEVASLLNDKEEYSSVAKSNVTVKGLKNTTDYKLFLDENNSDLPLNTMIQYKSQVPQSIAEELFAGKVGETFGPYKDGEFFKISKITAVVSVPDSVKARHILIPFVGSRSADATVTKTDEQAKQTADSILTVIKKSPSKFKDLAKTFSADKSNADKGGDLDWFTYNRMVPEFRDYCFENKTGDAAVVKTIFGYHVIKIDNQKNRQNAVKLATFARKIQASEATENSIFQNAESFALEVSKGKKINEVAKEKGLKAIPAIGLKALDENIPSLGKERQIINWAFEKDLAIGSFKRFDVEGGYVVAVLKGKTSKGLMPVDKAVSSVRPILANQKKVELIQQKTKGATLADIASATNQNVRNVSSVSLKSPMISGVGYEPKVVGAMLNAKENSVIKNVVGDRGVYAFKITSKELPTALPNYNTERNRIANKRKNKSYQIFEALKKASNVEDNVGAFYGIQ